MVGFTKNETSTNASPQANIDPRVAAAELKKKLLNDKSVRAKRDNSVGTHGEVFHNTVRPETHSSSHTSATPTPVPHASPPMRTQNSVPTNAKELVALIKSISNTTQDSQVKTTGNMVEHKIPSGSVGTATANAGASCASLLQKTPGLDSVPHTSTVEATQSINASISTPTKDGEVVTGGTLPGVVNTPIRSANAKATSPPVEESKTDDKRMTISTPSKATATLAASHGEASVSPSIGPLQAKKRQDGGTTKDAGSIASWNTYYPSSHLGDLNEADKKNASTILKQPSCTAQARDINNGGASQTVSAKLAKLIEQDQDLRDWLLYTHYFDVEVRKKKLTRYRTLNEMEAAERKIKEEQERLAAARRKLLEEDGHDQSFLLYTTRAGHSQTSQSSAPATPITDVSSNRPPSTKPFGKSGIDAPVVKTSAGLKRVLDINDRQEKYSKMPKLDTEAARNSKTLEAEDERERDDRGRRKDHDRDGLATRCHHSGSYHRSRSSRRHSPFRAPHDKYKKYNHNSSDENYDNRGAHYHEMGRYEAHRGKGSHGDWARTPTLSERYSRLPVTDPKPVNLGGEGGQFYFPAFGLALLASVMQTGLMGIILFKCMADLVL